MRSGLWGVYLLRPGGPPRGSRSLLSSGSGLRRRQTSTLPPHVRTEVGCHASFEVGRSASTLTSVHVELWRFYTGEWSGICLEQLSRSGGDKLSRRTGARTVSQRDRGKDVTFCPFTLGTRSPAYVLSTVTVGTDTTEGPGIRSFLGCVGLSRGRKDKRKLPL